MGLRPGFPDIVVVADGHFIAIELKRTQGGNNGTPAQREWIEALTMAGIPAKICLGAEEAIAFVNAVVQGSARAM